MHPLFLASILLLCAVILLGLELLIPSGGFISVVAAACLLGAIVASFFSGPQNGILFSTGTGLGIIVGGYVLLKYWPKTRFGRSLISRPSDDEVDESVRQEEEEFQSLIGKSGVATTKMLPSGSVKLEGQSYDAISEGLPIEAGDAVEVVALRMHRVVVRKKMEQQTADQQQRTDTDSSSDILSTPIEKLGLDSLDDPLN